LIKISKEFNIKNLATFLLQILVNRWVFSFLRWDSPPEGFFSIQAQEEINAKHEEKERRKFETIYQQQSIHGGQAAVSCKTFFNKL